MKLQDKVAVITGGAMGIGEATGRLFAAEGATVALGDIADDANHRVARTLQEMGGQARGFHVDVRKPAQVEAFIRAVEDTFGGIDILVNNAGVALAKSTVDTSLEEWERVLGINLTGAWLCSRAVIPGMVERGGGTIVNVASNAGLVGFPNLAAYCASKGGLVQLTRAMALDCAPHIRVNAICPGHTRTPMGDGFVAAQPDPDAFVQDFINVQHPIGRMAEAEEVARGILFLASDDSSFVTGSILAADGGYSTR